MAMEPIKIYLGLFSGLMAQGEIVKVIREKNMVFVSLHNSIDDPKSFKDVFFRATNQRIFGHDMQKYKPTYDTAELKVEIEASPELLGVISLAYFEQGQPEWMRNLLRWILQKEIIDNLAIIARNAVFRELYEAIDSSVLFIFILMNQYRNSQIFASGNAELGTNEDIIRLKVEIEKRPNLLYEIEIAYRRAGQPEWMRNLLQYLV